MLHISRLMTVAAAATTAVLFSPLDAAIAASGNTMGSMVAVPSPMVPVPDNNGSGYAGCYQIQGPIYGAYNFSFCLNNRRASTYTVTGGGLYCNGGLDWYDAGGGNLTIDLYRAPCGRGQDWTGDGLNCRAAGWRPFVQGMINNNQPHMMVPVPSPQPGPGPIRSLSCRYVPVVGGYPPINVIANRV